MKRKNKYVPRSKISEAKFREIVRYFSIDLDASQIAVLSGLNSNTINRYLQGIRMRIAPVCDYQSPSMIDWSMAVMTRIFAAIMATLHLPAAIVISTGLKALGVWPRHVFQSVAACARQGFICI